MQKASRILAETAWRRSFYAPEKPKETARRQRHAGPPGTPRPRPAHLHRTIFISDTHLGTRGCKAELLADFLKHNDCDTLYLVGDIVDGWQFKRWYWSEAQDRVVREVLKKVDAGTRVIYVPGNHDEFLRAYTLALRLNDGLHAIRRSLGLPYWSLSAYLKRAVKNAVEYVSRYEEIVARAAAGRGVDGVVCGHIHHAEIRRIGDILYLNDGDWVESCSALVEDARGNLEILRWASSTPQGAAHTAIAPPALIPA